MHVPTVPPLTLETPRLLLRPWRFDDLASYAALNADLEVMRYFPAPMSAAESDAMAERAAGIIALRGWGLWAVEHKDSGEFIGCVGLNIPPPALPCFPCVEIGWRLARAWWRQGYTFEAARAVLDTAFTTLGFEEVVSFTALPNQPSQGVMEKLGMQRDAQTFQHPLVAEGHWLREHCLYRLARADWLRARSQLTV
ncbi:GNAT family N-acetyltransferase [Andreprevotia lacus]|jgi:RimJ/RimL family protein N-acetyltransferase|nr:GNAT family N-acetyltransferase [Andreprevotia lacus]